MCVCVCVCVWGFDKALEFASSLLLFLHGTATAVSDLSPSEPATGMLCQFAWQTWVHLTRAKTELKKPASGEAWLLQEHAQGFPETCRTKLAGHVVWRSHTSLAPALEWPAHNTEAPKGGCT